MITGDQQFTATAIGKELGITDGGIPAVNGGSIAQFSDPEMDEAAATLQYSRELLRTKKCE